MLSILITSIIFFSGCINTEEKTKTTNIVSKMKADHPSILPDWKEGNYHDSEKTQESLKYLNEKFPNLVNLFTIGKTVMEKDIWCIKITNEKNRTGKYSCLIDGCIHGNEWEAGEACIYLAEYLLINFNKNSTISNILNRSEIYIVPLVNPDGRDNNERWNENGIDLNRNFDVHFGRFRGGSVKLGKILNKIKIPLIKRPKIIERLGLDKIIKNAYWTNSGRVAFSEPETKAITDLMKKIGPKFSFYVNCHTAMHGVTTIVGVSHKPEFVATKEEINVLRNTLTWIKENTEYNIMYPDEFSFFGAGFAHHWAFKEFRVPSFCFEMLNSDFEPMFGEGRHDHLVHWMKTTLPVFMYFLVNIENLYNWQDTEIQPDLPQGVPPTPLK